ncbi:MAG: PAAR domain-containing protein [Chloroflexota bacterium]
MGQPAAKQNDKVVGVDIHIVMVPAPPAPPIPTPLPHPFNGKLDGGLSSNVKITGKPAAILTSTATNSPSHTPTPPGTTFQAPPQNKSNIIKGSATVLINNKPAARMGDTGLNCGTPPAPTGSIIATGAKVLIGG